jgi:hypothetical protein
MSLSEIIKTKFKSKMKTVKVKGNAKDVAKYIIRDPASANQLEHFEGNAREKQALQTQINEVETNQMDSWIDLESILSSLKDSSVG